MAEEVSDSRLFIALLVVLVIIAAVFIYALELNRTPEAFTQAWIEVYPEQVLSLEEFDCSFTINSHETVPTTYNYTISSQWEAYAEEKVLVQGGTLLEPNETKTITHKLSLAETGEHQVLITISAEGKENPYELWFWVSVDAPEGA